jgi:hypothetical protein
VTTLVGLILGIIAVLEGNRAIKIYEAEPQQYSPKDYENAKTGKLLGWISIGISIFLYHLTCHPYCFGIFSHFTSNCKKY